MMNCAELRRLGNSARGPEVKLHLAGCKPCRELRAAGMELARVLDAADAPGPVPAAPDFASVAAALSGERGTVARVRSWSTSARSRVTGTAVAGLALLIVLFSRRPDFALYPGPRLALECAALLVPALLALFSSQRPLSSAAASPRKVFGLLAAAILVPWVLAMAPQAHALHPSSNLGTGEDLVSRAVACFLFGMVCALPVLLTGAALDRGGQRSRTRAALVAAGAGLSGTLAISLHCGITAPVHLVAGHAPIAMALILLWMGVQLRRRFTTAV